MIATYEACFSEAYRSHRENLAEAFSSIGKTISTDIEGGLKRVADLNTSRALAWRQFIEASPLPFDMAKAAEILAEAREALSRASERKMGDPIEVITL
jgi:hypothetical protein